MANEYHQKINREGRIIRANAHTETDLHEHIYGSSYDEYPIDPAILQQAENYTFGDSAIPLLRQFLDHNLAQADQQEMFPYARFRLFNDPAFALDRNP
jgi:hypothetical protein